MAKELEMEEAQGWTTKGKKEKAKEKVN